MSVAAADSHKKLKYHHGDLRPALIEAGLRILETEGIEALSLRAIARATGVTQAAPYSHFGDKDELLAAVAETGFQRLAMQMADEALGQRDVQVRIEKLMSAYIRFALANKPLFQLMFSRELSEMNNYPTLAMTAGKSYALISAALAGRNAPAEDTRFLTLTIWSLCHGLTTMLVDGKIRPAAFGADDAEALVRRTIENFSDKLR